LIKQCPKCKKGEIDYSLSDIYFIENTEPQEAGLEGICSECSTHIYVKFRHYESEITPFNDFMDEQEKEVIKA
jgi:hypothetical protein